MEFVKAYPTFVCYLLQIQLKQPNTDRKPKKEDTWRKKMFFLDGQETCPIGENAFWL